LKYCALWIAYELLPNFSANVISINAFGQITAGDYTSVVIPAIEAAIKEGGNVRILYQLGPAFTGFTAGAMWEDTPHVKLLVV